MTEASQRLAAARTTCLLEEMVRAGVLPSHYETLAREYAVNACNAFGWESVCERATPDLVVDGDHSPELRRAS